MLLLICKVLGIVLLLFLLCCILYTIVGFFCTIIPINKNYKNVKKDIEIYLYSDGIHTDFIVPAIRPCFNWSNIISDQHYNTKFTPDTFLGIGWGDRGFYLDIPTWADLTPKIAFKAMCIPSSTLLHVSSLASIPSNKKYVERIHLTESQYLLLCDYISSYFKVADDKIIFIPDVGYTPDDQFYEGNGLYHALNTCNFWVNKGLVLIGVRMPIWSHWGGGIFYQLRKASM